MAFVRPKKREPVGEAGLFEYAVGALARRMRTVRDLRRLMKARAEEGEAGERAMDAVIVRLKELNYLSDTRFAEDYTRVRKENEKFGKRRVQQDLMMKGWRRSWWLRRWSRRMRMWMRWRWRGSILRGSG
ncbi:regulatory protein RecX [Tunturiibacter empetritectus]|uniref:regulatory protein RecX n=1 Tax=Tunturiibacter empetritectus TaxID=3069691 RepID=UPI003D9BAE31